MPESPRPTRERGTPTSLDVATASSLPRRPATGTAPSPAPPALYELNGDPTMCTARCQYSTTPRAEALGVAAIRFGGDGLDAVRTGVVSVPGGGIVFGGPYRGPVQLLGRTLPSTQDGPQFSDAFVAKLDATGELEWEDERHRIGSASAPLIVAVDEPEDEPAFAKSPRLPRGWDAPPRIDVSGEVEAVDDSEQAKRPRSYPSPVELGP